MDRVVGWRKGSLALAASAVFAGCAWQASRFVYLSESGAVQGSTEVPAIAVTALLLLLGGLLVLWRRQAAWGVGLLLGSLTASLAGIALGALQ